MADADPFDDLLPTDCVGEGVQRVAHYAEDLADADFG
jgi:hypothetical protein